MTKLFFLFSHFISFLIIGALISCSADNNNNSVLNREIEMKIDSSLVDETYTARSNVFSIQIPVGWQALPDSTIKSNNQDMAIDKIYRDSLGSMLIISEITSNIPYDSLIAQKGRELKSVSAIESVYSFKKLRIDQWIIRNPKGSMVRFITKISDIIMQFDYVLSDNNFKVAESSFGSLNPINKRGEK